MICELSVFIVSQISNCIGQGSYYEQPGCCLQITVSGKGSEFDGTYNLQEKLAEKANVNCYDSCLYSRDGESGTAYCFR